VLLHSIFEVVLKIFEISKIGICEIVGYFPTFLHSKVQQYIGLIFIFIVLGSQLNLEPPSEPLKLSQMIELLPENNFSKFL